MGEENNEVTIDFENADVKAKIGEYVSKNYREFIPEEYATDAVMASVPDLATLAKNYKHAQSAVGKKGIIMPTEKDGPEAWGEFFQKLGRPEKETEYEFESVEGMEMDLSDIRKAFAKQAHEEGLTKKQAKTLWKFYETRTKEGQDALVSFNKQRWDKEWTDLKQEWGAAYPEKIKKLDNLVAKYGDDEFRDYLKQTRLGKETKLVKFLSKLSDAVSEDKLESASSPASFTPKEAMSKANDIRTNKSNPLFEAFWDKRHIRHKEAADEVNRLYKMAYPETK
jgi:hypothetical protein